MPSGLLISISYVRQSSSRLTSFDTKKPHERYAKFFERHTDLIEPLSLDEAYLDVTESIFNREGIESARRSSC